MADPKTLDVAFSAALSRSGVVTIKMATVDDGNLDEYAFTASPVEAIELGQKMIAAGVRAIRLASGATS